MTPSHSTDLPSNSNISKAVTVNIAITEDLERVFDKISNDNRVDRLWNCGSLVIDVESVWNY